MTIKFSPSSDNTETIPQTDVDEDFFTEDELKSIFDSAGIDKVQKKALLTLGEILADIGYSIAKIAVGYLPDQTSEITEEHIIKAGKRYISLNIPMIHYMWIISENGTCLFSKSYSGLQFPDTIFAGLLVGIANMTTEVTGRTLEKLVIGDLTVHLQEVSPILCAVISDDSKGIIHLVRELGKQFLQIYGHRVLEAAIDINVFSSFEKHARNIIRDFGIAIPSDSTGDSVQKLLDPDIIRQGVIVAAQNKDLKIAMQELKKLPIFTEDKEKNNFDSLLGYKMGIYTGKKTSMEKKTGIDLIQEIFAATKMLKNAMNEADSEIDENEEKDKEEDVEDLTTDENSTDEENTDP